MKKIFFIIMICMFLTPVYAKEEPIYIKGPLNSKIGEGVVSNDKEKVDLEFNDLGQDAKYEAVIYNDTNKKMYVNDLEVSGLSEKFIEFKLDTKSENIMIEPNSSTKVSFSVNTLFEEGAGRNLDDNISLNFKVSDKSLNPSTFSNLVELIMLILILGGTIYLIRNNNNKRINILMIIGVASFCSFIHVDAADFVKVSIPGKIKYTSQNKIMTSGTVLNDKKADYTNSKEVWAYYDKVKKVQVKSLIKEPSKYYKKFDLTENKTGRVMAYLIENNDKDTPYDLTIMSNGVVVANSDSSFMFSFPNTESIEGLSNVDFREATSMQGMFIGNEKITKIEAKAIEMENTTDASYMFYNCDEIKLDKDDFELENVTNDDYMILHPIYSEVKKDAVTDKNENFDNKVVNTGKYFMESTKKDEFPIYYYRGDIENNNVVFGGFCWKIVRTTDTGGTKLIYNGMVKDDGSCDNSGSESILNSAYSYDYGLDGVGYMIGDNGGGSGGSYYFESGFNLKYNSNDFYIGKSYIKNDDGSFTLKDYISINRDDLTENDERYIGYYICGINEQTHCNSIKKIYKINSSKVSYNEDFLYVFGNDVKYIDGNYHLIDTHISNGWSYDRKTIMRKYHYTCMNTTGVCENVKYLTSDSYYQKFSDGQNLETYKSKAFNNVYDSEIKRFIDEWYRNNLINYTAKIEDTIWCNDREISYGFLRSKDENVSLYDDEYTKLYDSNYFGSYKRLKITHNFNVNECTNKNDRFTVNNDKGNKKLTYPVATITTDELAISGFTIDTSGNSYLDCGSAYWTMSPWSYNTRPCIYTVSSSGGFYCEDNDWGSGVRPMISLKHKTKYVTGNGSVTNPYIIE